MTEYDPMILLKSHMKDFKAFVKSCDTDAILLSKALGEELQEAYNRKQIDDKQSDKISQDINQLIFDYKRNCACKTKRLKSS